jgi:antitoxin component of MazEF toxin-antitoxin module
VVRFNLEGYKLITNKMPETRESRNILGHEEEGEYCDLYIGDTALQGHVDATHAAAIEEDDLFERLFPKIHTQHPPKEGHIMLNPKVRRILGVNPGDKIAINNFENPQVHKLEIAPAKREDVRKGVVRVSTSFASQLNIKNGEDIRIKKGDKEIVIKVKVVSLAESLSITMDEPTRRALGVNKGEESDLEISVQQKLEVKKAVRRKKVGVLAREEYKAGIEDKLREEADRMERDGGSRNRDNADYLESLIVETEMPPEKGEVCLSGRMRRILKMKKGKKYTLKENDSVVAEFVVKKGKKVGDKIRDVIVHPDDIENFKRWVKKARAFSDQYTGEIARQFGEIGGSFIIGKSNRLELNLNRPDDTRDVLGTEEEQGEANAEYRRQKRAILEKTGNLEGEEAKNKYLHIALHGKGAPGFAIGTKNGKTCHPDIQKWFVVKLKEKIGGYGLKEKDGQPPIVDNNSSRYPGDDSKSMGREMHGENYNTIQLEVGRHLRKEYQEELAQIFHEIIEEFTSEIAKPPTTDASEDALDDEREQTAEETRKKVEKVLTPTKHQLEVRKQFGKYVGEDKVTFTPDAAEKAGVVTGEMVLIRKGENEIKLKVEVLKIVSKEDGEELKGLMCVDAKAREWLDAEEGEKTDFEVLRLSS